MLKRFFFLIVLAGACMGAAAFAVDSLTESNPRELESNAKYNYYIGQYYYNQGRFDDAQAYFERSRDLMQRRKDVLAKEAFGATMPIQATGGPAGLEYRIGEGDVLFISVWQNDDLNQEVVVRPDGKISFPLVGQVMAAGATVTAVTEELTVKLKEYIRFPQVSISIRKLGGSKVVILGQVWRPGVYAVSGSRTLLEAIALAGGFTNDAVSNSIVLIRGGLKSPQASRLNLKKALVGTSFDGNVMLQSEDIIFVPKTFISDLSYVLNLILDPVSRGAMTAQSVYDVGNPDS
jgi:polysaccharide export outer membrane protein